uniref:USP domain-containing protein n=1 Tax=Plectus sambesii TaxID=2011161 RepID=A0A914VAW5_9BILA
MSIMRCVQMIFANLLGSQLQFYIPRRFWRRFRFGEQPVNLREQQDALEFFNSVVESVDEGLKSLGEAPACERVFGGLFADQKICKGCPHRYQRDEPFTSLSVDIRSHNNLLDSLKEYVKGDLLDNDNAYLCERCNKKVAAIKRLCISKLPACLTIQLKRFDFDWEHEVPVKFNDCFEFPLELDMEPYTVRGLAKQEGESIAEEEIGQTTDTTALTPEDGSSLFRLRGVVVHSGQANGGHYYSFIRSDRGDGKWYKFDDTDVHEHDLSTEDDMRNAWFGGEYITDMFDHITKRYTPRRQKRWWNAYLLFYERITADQPAECPSTVAQLNSQMESMSLSSKLRLMLPELEAVVRAKNTRVLHERNEYTPEYFQFIRQLTTIVAAPQFLKNANIPEQERKEMALLAVQLLGKFLFTTGLHAKRCLRGNMQDWLNNIVALFAFSAESRLWFVDSVLYGNSRTFSLYLFESTSTEVRHFFVRLLVVLMEKSRDDPADRISQLRHTCESVSDLLIRTLLTLPITNTNDFHRHPCQYFALFYHYASLGPIEKQQLLKHGVLTQMLKIVLEEHQLTRGMYAEMAKCYQTVGLLIRCCDVSEYCQSAIEGEPLRLNPFAVSKEPATKMPEDVGSRLFSPAGVERFCRAMLDQSTAGYDVTRSLLQFLCWENMAFTKSAFRSFNWESLFSWNDIKQYLKVLEALLEMQDTWQKERILFGLRGDGVDKPKPMGILKLMRSNYGFSAKKCYSMLKMITQFIESSNAAQEVLEENADVKEEYVSVTAWLKLELDAAQRHEENYGATSNYGHHGPPSNEAPGVGNSGLERSNSAMELLTTCRRVCKRATGKDRPDRTDERRVDSEMHPTRRSSTGGRVGGRDESDDDEDDDEDDREGPFASLSMEEHRGGPPDALPPPYTDQPASFSFSGPASLRMRHSQSASSGLDSGTAPDVPSVDNKIPLSRTTDGGFHPALSKTAPARSTAVDPTLAFTSPKSMETQDDLSRSVDGREDLSRP